jgi:pimeloyl-ACP methyl ester carboxylesterase
MRTYSSRRLALRYYDWAGQERPPLILVHGTRDHARSWDWTARALRNDYHVLAPDLAGHGESEWDLAGSYQFQDYVYDLAELVRSIAAPRVRIIGHSLGGRIALSFAGAFPERVEKVIAIEGMGVSDETWIERHAAPGDERLRKWIEARHALNARTGRAYQSVDDVAQKIRSRNPHFTAEQAQHLALYTVKQRPDGAYALRDDPAVMTARLFEFGVADRAALFGAIACDVLLIQGDESWLPNPAQDGREKLFRSVRTITFDGAGHWAHHDRFEDFVREARSFLAT